MPGVFNDCQLGAWNFRRQRLGLAGWRDDVFIADDDKSWNRNSLQLRA